MKTNKQLLRKARIRYILVYFVLAPAQVLALLFPLAWVLRFLGKFNPLWIVLDDTRLDSTRPSGYAKDYEIWLRDFKYQWLGVLLWHVRRNRVWNLLEMFKVPKYSGSYGNQNIVILEYYKDNLFATNDSGFEYHLEQDGGYTVSAGLKYIPKHPDDDIWNVNRGDEISYRTSVLGEGYILYRDVESGWVGYRYTSCKKVKHWIHFGKEMWHTKFFGSNGQRYSFKWKYQKLKPWK